ncbi:transposase [Streptomyces sp. ISL-98]|nr:transposase [Streptomyces sp. ISL-98]
MRKSPAPPADAGATWVGRNDWHAEQNIELMGPVFADTTAQGRAGDGLGQGAFTVDWPARTVTCPRGRRSVSWSAQRKPTGTEIIRVLFAKRDCDACPVRARCTSATNHQYGRSLTLLTQPQQQALDQRRREQGTAEWRAAYGHTRRSRRRRLPSRPGDTDTDHALPWAAQDPPRSCPDRRRTQLPSPRCLVDRNSHRHHPHQPLRPPRTQTGRLTESANKVVKSRACCSGHRWR